MIGVMANDAKVDVFLSWAGAGSNSFKLAERLHTWLRDVLHVVEPFMSAADIEAGTRWSAELQHRLRSARVAVVIVTPANQHHPWLYFEAGAVGLQVGDANRVITMFHGMARGEHKKSPLTEFQNVLADEGGFRKVVKSINSVSPHKLEADTLDRAFKKWWPDMEEFLATLKPEKEADEPRRKGATTGPPPFEGRSADDMFRETLEEVRELRRLVAVLRNATHQPQRPTPLETLARHMESSLDEDRIASIGREILTRVREAHARGEMAEDTKMSWEDRVEAVFDRYRDPSTPDPPDPRD